ncbi:methyltransferase [Streptomyces alkaliphilus]|uniref:Methyltransferase n=1 Tax=Streptomyces alkaliphilus TaxID=1472722 RepID=A0A7W3XZS3_9ACTN|nr:class I SAM-dependent methyltransferase [Streptomyces alkaliphilus]MBB0242576.1 methyltransferase [Streptomyces alkaliphilus]
MNHTTAPTPATLLDGARAAGLSALRSRNPGVDPGRMPGAMDTLGRIGLAAVASLLAASGALRPDGPPRTPGRIMDGLAVAPRHVWLVRLWLDALVADGVLVRSDDGRRLSAAGDLPAGADEDLEEAYAALGFPPVMPAFHRSVLARLPELLRDEVSVRQLLFPDGDALTALAGYQTSAAGDYVNAAAGHAVREVVERLRPRAARIVELGAGAGVCTSAVLGALEGVGADHDYLFTDVSRLFTVAARDRYAPTHPGLRCALLDIDGDFTAQGLEPGSADVVLAGNVLHNATDAAASLRRVRELLAPGGRLVFTESVGESRAILTSMAFLLSPEPGRPRPGSGDRRRETGSSFLDAAGWEAELRAAGLVPLGSLPHASSPIASVGQYLFLADAPSEGSS